MNPTGASERCARWVSILSVQDGDAHDEGGGPNGCVLYYSVRGESEALFDMLDADLNVTATLHTADFKAILDAQQQAA